jgi:hypothetical protein
MLLSRWQRIAPKDGSSTVSPAILDASGSDEYWFQQEVRMRNDVELISTF